MDAIDEGQLIWAENVQKQSHGCCRYEPDDQFRQIWDGLQVLFLTYIAITIPIRFAFMLALEPGSLAWLLELAIDMYFVVDFVLNFRTGYVNESQLLIMNLRKIRRRYVRGWFAIDVLAILPFSYVAELVGAEGNTGNKAFKIFRMFRLAKLLRLAKIKRIVKQYAEHMEGLLATVTLIGLLAGLLFLTHLITCVYYWAGGNSSCGWVEGQFLSLELDNPPTAWVMRRAAGDEFSSGSSSGSWDDVPAINNSSQLVPPYVDELSVRCGADGNGWGMEGLTGVALYYTDGDNILHLPGLASRYQDTFWFSLSIIVGSERGDIGPRTHSELVLTVFIMLIGACIFGMVIGAVSSLLLKEKLLEKQIQMDISELNEYLEKKRISKELKRKVRSYMEVLHRKRTGYNEKGVLSSLPTTLANILCDHLYKKQIHSVPLFHGMREEIVVNICHKLKPFQINAGGVIFKEGHLGREMFIIESGVVQLSRYGTALSELMPGAFFGEGSLLISRHVRGRTAMALEDSMMTFVTKEDVDLIGREHPALVIRIKELSDERAARESQKLTEMLDKTAEKLRVEPGSETMQALLKVVSARSNLSDCDSAQREQDAVLRIQRASRGRQDRIRFEYLKKSNGQDAKAQKALAEKKSRTRVPLGAESFQNWLVEMAAKKLLGKMENVLSRDGPEKTGALLSRVRALGKTTNGANIVSLGNAGQITTQHRAAQVQAKAVKRRDDLTLGPTATDEQCEIMEAVAVPTAAIAAAAALDAATRRAGLGLDKGASDELCEVTESEVEWADMKASVESGLRRLDSHQTRTEQRLDRMAKQLAQHHYLWVDHLRPRLGEVLIAADVVNKTRRLAPELGKRIGRVPVVPSVTAAVEHMQPRLDALEASIVMDDEKKLMRGANFLARRETRQAFERAMEEKRIAKIEVEQAALTEAAEKSAKAADRRRLARGGR